jgi:prepilin-type N-terminal cleavage/methylation domain-containing protein/prepilin-type processing-associated H-X9-DG protein
MKRKNAFTLIELLVVIVIIAILASLLLPVLSRSKQESQGIKCLSNTRQLTTAWMTYAGDSGDYLMTNICGYTGNPTPSSGQVTNSWAAGWEDWSNPDDTDNTDVLKLMSPFGLLWPYSQSAGIYRCPSDPSPLIRSVSMNLRMNGSDWPYAPTADYTNPNKLSSIVNPTPANAFVFIDERADSINDGFFTVEMVSTNANATLGNIPASYHNGRSAITFADGHADLHRWLDPRTEPPLNPYMMQGATFAPNDPDVAWIQQHCSARINQ